MVAVFFFFQNPDRKESKLSTKEKIQQIDLFGAGFLIAAIVCLLLALQVRYAYIPHLHALLTPHSGAVQSTPGPTPKSGAASSASASYS